MPRARSAEPTISQIADTVGEDGVGSRLDAAVGFEKDRQLRAFRLDVGMRWKLASTCTVPMPANKAPARGGSTGL